MLRGLCSEIDLDQHARMQSKFAADPVDVPGDLQVIHRMNHLHQRQHLAHLVGLQWPDEVPAYFFRQLRLLDQDLLHAVLAKHELSGIQRRLN